MPPTEWGVHVVKETEETKERKAAIPRYPGYDTRASQEGEGEWRGCKAGVAPVHGREHRSTEGDHRSTKKLRETTDPQEPSVHQSRVAAAHQPKDLEIPKRILGVSTRR